MTQDLEKLKEWIGQKESDIDYVTVPAVHRLAATLDRADPMPKMGDPLPIGWHQILFPRVVRHSQVGADGHPERGDFLPPVPLPRRMFAGKRTTFHADLHVGDAVRRESVIKDVVIKQGQTGKMVFVTVKTEITGPRGNAITEEHDYVYREAAPGGTPPQPPRPAPGKAVWSRVVTPDPVLLFRYSALTFNGHRIHYDRDYVTKEEGYPGLVVHGPLIATLLADLLGAVWPGSALKRFAFKAVRPLFHLHPFDLCAKPGDDGHVALWARDHQGMLAMQADAQIG